MRMTEGGKKGEGKGMEGRGEREGRRWGAREGKGERTRMRGGKWSWLGSRLNVKMCCHGHIFVFKEMGRVLKGRGRMSGGEPAEPNPSLQTQKRIPYGMCFCAWLDGLG